MATTAPEAAKLHTNWIAVVRGLVVLALLFLVAAMVTLDAAQPDRSTLVDRLRNKVLRKTWDWPLVTASWWLLRANIVLCLSGLGIDAFLARGHGARYVVPLLILLCLTIVGLFVHFRVVP